jgi:hypothetical protein
MDVIGDQSLQEAAIVFSRNPNNATRIEVFFC